MNQVTDPTEPTDPTDPTEPAEPADPTARLAAGAPHYACPRPAPARRDRGIVTVLGTAGAEVMHWSVPDGGLRPMGIRDESRIESVWPAADGSAVFRLVDSGGDEIGHVVRRDHDDPARPGDVDVTPDLPPYVLRGFDVSLDGRWVALNPVTVDGWDLVVAPADPGRPEAPVRRLHRSGCEAWNCRISADGRLATLDTTEHDPGRRRWAITAFDVTDGRRLASFRAKPGLAASAVRLSPLSADRRVLVAEECGPDGFVRPALWDPVTGAVHRPAIPAELAPADADLRPLDWSTDGRRLLLCRERFAEQRLLVHDLQTGRTVEPALPAGSVDADLSPTSWFGPDGSVLACWSGAADPVRVLRWTPDGQVTDALPAPSAPAGARYRSVLATGDDGTPVQAWLATPPDAGPHPAMVHVHGGPHVVSVDEYDSTAQTWVAAGFAYVEVNYRGSTGRGRSFLERVHGDVGQWELADLAAVHRMLIAEGITVPGHTVLSGESYGGFLTLLAMVWQPELWAAGIAEVAIGDWTSAYRDAAPAIRGAMATWFGGTPDQLPELYRDRSPITHLDRLRAPVLIRQGRSDTRTPPAQLAGYLARAQELGKDVTVQWYDGGHGSAGDTGSAEHAAFIGRALALARATVSG